MPKTIENTEVVFTHRSAAGRHDMVIVLIFSQTSWRKEKSGNIMPSGVSLFVSTTVQNKVTKRQPKRHQTSIRLDTRQKDVSKRQPKRHQMSPCVDNRQQEVDLFALPKSRERASRTWQNKTGMVLTLLIQLAQNKPWCFGSSQFLCQEHTVDDWRKF